MQRDAGKVVTRINRVPPEVVAAYRGLYSGLIVDAMEKLNIMSPAIKPLSTGMRICGPAVTSLGPDLTVRRMAIDLMQPGDVLVVAAGGTTDYACFGDGTATRMITKDAEGAVIDGCVRDAAGLRDLGFPTFSLGVSARNYHYPAGIDHGAVNVPVVCGTVLVEPGDLVFGDDDGIVVVPRQRASEVYELARAQLEREKPERASWTNYPAFAVREELERRGYVFVD